MSGRYCAKYFCGGPFQVAIGKWLGPDDGAASALLPAQRPPSYPIRKSGAAPSLGQGERLLGVVDDDRHEQDEDEEDGVKELAELPFVQT